jgi:hypothetical protein
VAQGEGLWFENLAWAAAALAQYDVSLTNVFLGGDIPCEQLIVFPYNCPTMTVPAYGCGEIITVFRGFLLSRGPDESRKSSLGAHFLGKEA